MEDDEMSTGGVDMRSMVKRAKEMAAIFCIYIF